MFVLPSYSENFGISIVEAMAHGIPVILSENVNIWREIAAEKAGIVIPAEANAVADAMRLLLNDEHLRKEMSVQGRALVSREFAWSMVGDKALALYERVMRVQKGEPPLAGACWPPGRVSIVHRRIDLPWADGELRKQRPVMAYRIGLLSSTYRGVVILTVLALMKGAAIAAIPVVFRVSEPVAPGDVVLLYGGGLSALRTISVSRLPDGDPGDPGGRASPPKQSGTQVDTLQPSAVSMKFVLPNSMTPGVFVADIGGESLLVDQPRVYWCQPTRLLPGLVQNEAASGATLQIVGRNFIPEGGKQSIVRAVLKDGVRLVPLRVTKIDKYSLLATIPVDTPTGKYSLWIHNGYGGPSAWGGPLEVTIKPPTVWPSVVFNIRNFGAHGDNIHDDSEPLRSALAAAGRNGGGIIYFSAGTYRLDGLFLIPHRVILRGERRDITWLKWPETEPQSTADFAPSVLYSTGEFGIEHISMMARNTETILRDLSWDAATTGKAPLPQLQSLIVSPGLEHDLFLRDIDFQLLTTRDVHRSLLTIREWAMNGFGGQE